MKLRIAMLSDAVRCMAVISRCIGGGPPRAAARPRCRVGVRPMRMASSSFSKNSGCACPLTDDERMGRGQGDMCGGCPSDIWRHTLWGEGDTSSGTYISRGLSHSETLGVRIDRLEAVHGARDDTSAGRCGVIGVMALRCRAATVSRRCRISSSCRCSVECHMRSCSSFLHLRQNDSISSSPCHQTWRM